METIEKLNLLAERQAQLDVMRLAYDEQRKAIIPAEIQAQLDDLDDEWESARTMCQAGVDELTAEIKADVIQAGATVKGDTMMAVWTKGRVSWDSKALDGYAAGHPEIVPFRKEGEPSVSIRKL